MKSSERRLLEGYRKLSGEQRRSMDDFLAFLLTQDHAESPQPPTEPVDILRPERESVIKAMRRLTETYPMIDTAVLFSRASSLMSQNVIQGRPAGEVIDELESLFQQHYQQFLESRSGT